MSDQASHKPLPLLSRLFAFSHKSQHPCARDIEDTEVAKLNKRAFNADRAFAESAARFNTINEAAIQVARSLRDTGKELARVASYTLTNSRHK